MAASRLVVARRAARSGVKAPATRTRTQRTAPSASSATDQMVRTIPDPTNRPLCARVVLWFIIPVHPQQLLLKPSAHRSAHTVGLVGRAKLPADRERRLEHLQQPIEETPNATHNENHRVEPQSQTSRGRPALPMETSIGIISDLFLANTSQARSRRFGAHRAGPHDVGSAGGGVPLT
jgi:hypothetical protein